MVSASEQNSVLFSKFALCVCCERFYQSLASQSLTLSCCQVTHTNSWASSSIQRCDLTKLFKSELKFQKWWWVLALCKAHHSWTKALMTIGAVVCSSAPKHSPFLDKKKEKDVCAHVKQEKIGKWPPVWRQFTDRKLKFSFHCSCGDSNKTVCHLTFLK